MGAAQVHSTNLAPGKKRTVQEITDYPTLKMISFLHHFGLLVLLAAFAAANEVASGQSSAAVAAQHRDLLAQRLMHDSQEAEDLYSRLVEDRNILDDETTQEEEDNLAEILKRSPHFWKRSHAFWKRSPAFWKRSAFWKRASFW
ncbi:hypothetical protein AAHC03_0152 [Spirometra sp. Aus1]